MFWILCAGFLFLIQSVVGPHFQLCFSSCASKCSDVFAGASLGDDNVNPEKYYKQTFIAGSADLGTWATTLKPVINGLNGHPLFGWFFLESSGSPTIEIFSIQAESQESLTNGVGSFVYPSDGGGSCEPTGEAKNILPCFMIKSPYHLTSTAFGNSKSTWGSFKALHRLDFPPCPVFDEKKNFRYRVYLSETENSAKNIRPASPLVNVKNYAYGAADPEPPKGNMKCGGPEPVGSWMNNPTTEAYTDQLGAIGEARCAVGKATGWSSSQMLFYGRCPEGKPLKVKPGETPKYECNEGNDFYNNLRDHHEYIKADLRDPVCQSCHHIWNNSGTIGHSANSKIGHEIWSLRKCHAVLMTIFTMFLLPVSIFFSRYFKETFMRAKLVHLPVWYAIHVHMSMAQLGILSGGLISAIWARSFFGLSTYTYSVLHDAMGWIAVLFFLLAFLSSSFRLKVKKARMLSIFLHYIFGNMVILLCLLGMITSCFIPGSPAARSEVTHTENSKTVGIELRVEPVVFYVILFRLVMEAVFPLLMNFNLKAADKQMGLAGKRKYAVFCVPMPLYDLSSKKDIPGGKMRKILLVVYIVLSLFQTLAISVYIVTQSSENRFFGPMRYTHKPNGKLFAVNRIESYNT